MSWIAVAVAGGAIVGGLLQGNAAQNAAQTQANAAENAQQISLQEFNTINQQEQPYIQSGYGAMSALDYGLGIPGSYAPGGYYPGPGNGGTPPAYNRSGGASNPGGGGSNLRPFGDSGLSTIPRVSLGAGAGGGAPVGTSPSAAGSAPPGFGSLVAPFTTANWQQLSPAYNFQLQQGQQNVLNTDAASQGSLSGAASKDLINYNQNLANTSFNNAFNQYQTQQGNIFSRLSGIANLGQSAASQTAQSGTALAGQAAQSATNVGTALAGGQVGAANAYAGALSSSLPWLYQAGSSPAANFNTSGDIGTID